MMLVRPSVIISSIASVRYLESSLLIRPGVQRYRIEPVIDLFRSRILGSILVHHVYHS